MRRRRRDVGPPVPAMLTNYEEPDWRRAGDSPGAPFDRWRAARRRWGESNPGSPLGDIVDQLVTERATRHRLAGGTSPPTNNPNIIDRKEQRP